MTSEDLSRLRTEFAAIREDADALSGRLSSAVGDVLQGIHRLREVDDRLDALFSCAAEFARTSKDPLAENTRGNPREPPGIPNARARGHLGKRSPAHGF